MSPEAGVSQQSPPPRPVSVIALLFGLAAGPAAWILAMVVDYGVAGYACFPGTEAVEQTPPPGWGGARGGLLVLDLLCVALAVAAFWVAWRCWRASGGGAGGGETALAAAGPGRSRFLAFCGMLAAAGSVVAILAQIAVLAALPACWDFHP